MHDVLPRRHRVLLNFLLSFNATPATDIYTLSLHDALPISRAAGPRGPRRRTGWPGSAPAQPRPQRSEEHTSELQSLRQLVCRLLLEKKKTCGCQVNLIFPMRQNFVHAAVPVVQTEDDRSCE